MELIGSIKSTSTMTDICRYLISKDPALLTTKSVLSVFKHADQDLNEYVIQTLQTNQSPVLLELYQSIFGTASTHLNFIEKCSAGTPGSMVKSCITGNRMTLKDYYQEWYIMA